MRRLRRFVKRPYAKVCLSDTLKSFVQTDQLPLLRTLKRIFQKWFVAGTKRQVIWSQRNCRLGS